MRLPTLLNSTAIIATALLGVSSSAFAQCPGGRCPAPQQYNQNPHWQGNQNPSWQGNQNPNYRNDGGWDNQQQQQTYYQNQSTGNNYYSNQPNLNRNDNSGFSNSSHMFDEDTNNQNQNNYLSNNPATNSQASATTQSQGYFYKNENNQSANANGQNAGPDSLVQHRVDEALKNNYLKKNFETVNARVYNGNVTLSGTAETEEDRLEVESRIRAIQGVKNVNDQIKVTPALKVSSNEDRRRNNVAVADVTTSNKTAVVTDKDLKKQIDDALKNNYVKKNYDTVIVTVTNGVITVSGVIEEEKDRQEIRDRIQKIKGVSNINDRLQVSAVKK